MIPQSECVRAGAAELNSVYGQVHDGETLARIVFSPNHVGKDGVRASVISNSRLREGLSVMRVGYICEVDFNSICDAIASSASGNSVHGFLICEASAARKFKDQHGRHAFCVFEDATRATSTIPENQVHALIVLQQQYSDADLVGLRTEMRDNLFSGLVSLIRNAHPC